MKRTLIPIVVLIISVVLSYLYKNVGFSTADFASKVAPRALPLPPLASPISVTEDHSLAASPLPYQVFQRKTLDRGRFTLKLKILLSTAQLIRVQVYDSQNNLLLATEQSANQRQNEIYQNSYDLPAGGWYRLQVEQVNLAAAKAFRTVISPFGIGDVFVTAGQSNATSAGQDLTFTNSRMVSAYVPQIGRDGHLSGPGSWQLNNDPQPPESLPSDSDAAAGGYLRNNFGSVWPTMGDELASRQNIPIATAACGVGGTTISQWQKDYRPEANSGLPIYTRLMETTKLLIQTTGVRMILWDQGESDNLSESQTYPLEVYGNKFKKLQSDLAADVGHSLPWMIAKASFAPADPHLDGSPCDSQSANERWASLGPPPVIHSIILSQEKLINDRVVFEGPHTDKYIGAAYRYPGPRGSCIHFSEAAQIQVGRDWADQILKTRFGEFPDGSPVSQDGALKIGGPFCKATGGNCSVQFSWNNPDIQSAQLRVFVVGQSSEESLVGCLGSTGSIDVDWIVPGIEYRFSLYNGENCGLSTPISLIDQKIVKTSGPSTLPPPVSGSLPPPSGLTPIIMSAGRGCDDNLCLWFIVKNVEADFRIDMRKVGGSGDIDWLYNQDRMAVNRQSDGSFLITLRLTEGAAQQALRLSGINCWIVNPTSKTWTNGNLVQ